MPSGLPLRTSTLLSGPGGSGKPLIGDNFVAAWLRAGGGVVFMSLQYPSTDFIYESLKIVAGLDLNEYTDRVAFILLDAALDGLNAPDDNVFKANLVKPEVWDAAIPKACEMIAASFWSLLAPAIEIAGRGPTPAWLPGADSPPIRAFSAAGWQWSASGPTWGRMEERRPGRTG